LLTSDILSAHQNTGRTKTAGVTGQIGLTTFKLLPLSRKAEFLERLSQVLTSKLDVRAALIVDQID
jgi:hypothetical protein